MPESTELRPRPNTDFTETRWSVVNAAAENESAHGAAALETLCKLYWLPIYVYVRRRSYAPHDAQDATQEFFARIVSDNSFARADRSKGKFRSYLLGALNHFLADERDKQQAEKRGGGKRMWSLEAAEEKYSQIPTSTLSPEKAFDQRWGLILLEQGVRRLQAELKDRNKELQFELLKDFLMNEPADDEYEVVAEKLLMNSKHVAVIVYRLRQRFRQLLREELAQTVLSKEDLDEELRHLFFQ